MSTSERRAFLEEVRPAILSLNDDGKGPLASPVWYDLDQDGKLWFVTQNYTRKARLIEVGTRIALTVQRHKRPYAYVSVEGPVVDIKPYTLDSDLLPMANRYLGETEAQAYIERKRATFNPETSIRITMNPERFFSAVLG